MDDVVLFSCAKLCAYPNIYYRTEIKGSMQKRCIELFSGKELCEIHEYLNEKSEIENSPPEIENTPIEIENRHYQILNTPARSRMTSSTSRNRNKKGLPPHRDNPLYNYSISFCSPVWNHSSTFQTFVTKPS